MKPTLAGVLIIMDGLHVLALGLVGVALVGVFVLGSMVVGEVFFHL